MFSTMDIDLKIMISLYLKRTIMLTWDVYMSMLAYIDEQDVSDYNTLVEIVKKINTSFTYDYHALNPCILRMTSEMVRTVEQTREAYPIISRILNRYSKNSMKLFTAYKQGEWLEPEAKAAVSRERLLYQDSEQYEQKKQEAKDLVESYQHSQYVVNRDDIDGFIDRGLKTNATWADKAVALNYAVGSRPIEIISKHSANFIKGSTDDEIIQIGHAKAKGEKRWLEAKATRIIKPLYRMRYDEFTRLLKDVRDEVDHDETVKTYREHLIENERLNKKYVSRMSKLIATDNPLNKQMYGRNSAYAARKSYPSLTHDKTSVCACMQSC
jgi:hypothetical protein